MISKCLQILDLQPQISKVFICQQKNFFLTIGQNNFDNKIPFLSGSQNQTTNYEFPLNFLLFLQTQCMYLWIDGSGENLRAKTKTVDFVPKKAEGKSIFKYLFQSIEFLQKYRISANSLCTVTFVHSAYRCGNYSREETIQGRKLYEEIQYMISCPTRSKNLLLADVYLLIS